MELAVSLELSLTRQQASIDDLISPALFNTFLEIIVRDTFHDHHTNLFIGGRATCSLHFADDLDVIVGTKTICKT